MVSRGTWRAERVGDEWQVISTLPDGESEMIVAKVERARPGFTSPIDASDAKLMAASKELFSIAESVVLRGHANGCALGEVHRGLPVGGVRCDCLYEVARAAIAKAEGR